MTVSRSFRLRLIGNLEVIRDGEAIAAPASRKTRAILGYLALTGRPAPRQRLCDLFFDAPDDPRAALRWSLSKLRPLVDTPSNTRLIADRDKVRLLAAPGEVDALALMTLARAEPQEIADETLCSVLTELDGELLQDADLPDRAEYSAWLYAQRQDLRTIEASLLRERIRRLNDNHAERVSCFHRLIALDPLSEAPYAGLAASLKALGRRDEAQAIVAQGERALAEAGLRAGPALRAALRAPSTATPEQRPSAAPKTNADSRPSLFVIPFRNHSPDAISDADMDSMLESVVHMLSRFRSFRVAGVNSSLAYKNRLADPAEVRATSGADYMIGGSLIARDGHLTARYRIVDAADGALVSSGDASPEALSSWALIDGVPSHLVSVIAHQIYEIARQRAAAVAESERSAYDHFFCGLNAGFMSPPFDFDRAIACFDKAIARSPDFPAALALCAQAKTLGGRIATEADRAAVLAQAHAALAASNDDSQALAVAAWVVVLLSADFDAGLRAVDLAVRVNPLSRVGWTVSAWIRTLAGEYETPMQHWDAADRCNPFGAFDDQTSAGRALCAYLAGRLEEAQLWAKRCLDRAPGDAVGRAVSTAAAWEAGEHGKARAEAMRLLEAHPQGAATPLLASLPFRQSGHRSRLFAALNAAIAAAA